MQYNLVLWRTQLSMLGGVPLLALRKELSNTLPSEKVTYIYMYNFSANTCMQVHVHVCLCRNGYVCTEGCMYGLVWAALHFTGDDHVCLLPVSPATLTEKRRPSSDCHTTSMEDAQEEAAESVRDTEAASCSYYSPGADQYYMYMHNIQVNEEFFKLKRDI